MTTAVLTALVSADTGLATTKIAAFGHQLDTLGSSGTSSLTRLQTAGKVAFAAVGVAAIAGLGAAVSKTVELGAEVYKLSTQLGITTEAASKLRFAGEELGISTDKLSTGFGIFSKNIANANPKLDQYGVTIVRTANGQVDFNATLGNAADVFKALPPGVDRTAFAMNLFGRSGKDLIPILKLGSAGLKAMGDEAQRLGLVMSASDVAAARQLAISQRELKAAMDGLGLSIGTVLVPVLTTMAHVLTTVVAAFNVIPGPIKTAILVVVGLAGALTGLGLVMNVVKTSIAGLGISTGGLAAKIGALSFSFGPLGIAIGVATGGLVLFSALQAAGQRTVAAVTQRLLSQAGAWVELAKADEATSGGWRGISGRADVLTEAMAGAEKSLYAVARQVQATNGPLSDSQLALFKAAIAAHDYSGALDILRGAAAGATGPLTALDAANQKIQASADAAKLAELALAGGFLGIASSAQQASQAHDTLAAAQKKVNDLAKSGKKDTKAYQVALDAEHAAALAATTSQLGLATSVAQYIQQLHPAGVTQKQVTAEVAAFGVKAGLSAADVKWLTQMVLDKIKADKGIKPNISTKYTAPGLTTSIAAANNYKAIANSMDGRHVDTYWTSHYTSVGSSNLPGTRGGIQPQVGGVIGAAAGGITRRPTIMALVGEGSYPTVAGPGAEMIAPLGGSGGRYVKKFIGEAVRDAMGSGSRGGATFNFDFRGAHIQDINDFKRTVVGAVTEAVARKMAL